MCNGLVLPDGRRCTSVAELEAATGRVAPLDGKHDRQWTAYKRADPDWRNMCLCAVDLRKVAKRNGWRINTYPPFDWYAIAKDGTRADAHERQIMNENSAKFGRPGRY